MKISSKIQWLVAGLLAVIVATSALTIVQSRAGRFHNEHAYRAETLATAKLAQANNALWALRWGVAQMIALSDVAQQQKLIEADKKHYAEFKSSMAAFANEPVSSRARVMVDEVLANFDIYANARTKWFDLRTEGKNDEATALRAATLTPAGAATVASIGKLIDTLRQEAEENYLARSDSLQSVANAQLVVYAITFIVAAFLVLSIIRNMKSRFAFALEKARQVERLDLTWDERDHGKDEVSEMVAALDAARAKLVEVVGQARRSGEEVALASREIAQGTVDLSARTEAQSGTLQKTASSMEELTGTVRQNAENAQTANQLAASASAVARRGGEVVSEVVSTMMAINESSSKIVDIISVIDSIAFQTNILALNAAVEAARAGEEGRGFAVVASEVRSLAQRSASAAKDIKTLIDNSVDKVAVGARLVDQAGQTMQDIVTSVQQVTDIMGEIRLASIEQSAGIEEVNLAILQMDQATQQNAALVEQAAGASSMMQEQSASLVQAMSLFKLGERPAGKKPALLSA